METNVGKCAVGNVNTTAKHGIDKVLFVDHIFVLLI